MQPKASEPYPPLNDAFITPDACLDAAWVLLNELTVSSDTRLYFYAALELRLLIERLLRDVLAMMAPAKMSRSQRKLYLAADLYKEIRRLRPDFQARWQFLQQLYLGRRPKVVLPDFDARAVCRLYGELGRYLHSPGTPFSVIDEQTWKDRLEDVIDDAYTHLEPLGKLYRDVSPPPYVFDVELEWAFRQFTRGRLDRAQTRALGRRLGARL